MALVVLLLGMPLGCVLSTFHATSAHPCCPRTTSANLKCPYDLFDSAKATNHVAMAAVSVPVAAGVAPPSLFTSEALPHSLPPITNDLYISYRILRV